MAEAIRGRAEEVREAGVTDVDAPQPPPVASDTLIVVGITGRARSGKDAAATLLAAHRGCHRIALADGVRSAVADLGGPTGEFLKELTPSHNYRRALQLAGTEARDLANAPGLWVDLLLTKIAYAAYLHPVPRRRFAIPDVRYGHEESMIRHWVRRKQGVFAMLRLVRPGVDPIAESAHSSEAGVDGVPADRVIENSGSIADLQAAILESFDRAASFAWRRPETEEELFDAIEATGRDAGEWGPSA